MATKKKATKGKQNQAPIEPIPLMLAMGEVDLIFRINFRDEDLEKDANSKKKGGDDKNGDDRYYKVEELTDIKSLAFLEEREEVWDRFQLFPGNENMKIFIMGAKNNKKKCFIDYIGFGRPKFEGDEEFFESIFSHVTEKYNLSINKTPLDEGARYSLRIEMAHKGKVQVIQLGTTLEEEEEKKKEEEKQKKQEGQKKEDEKKKKEDDKKRKKEKMEMKEEMKKRKKKKKKIMKKMML